MVSLRELGITARGEGREAAVMLVGPNGSGKSTLLLDIARRYRSRHQVLIVSNTPHDRFVGLRSVKKLAVGKNYNSPKAVVKRAVVEALQGGSEFYQISSILEHCGYRPRFGFRLEKSFRYGISYDQLIEEQKYEAPGQDWARDEEPNFDEELFTALKFLQRQDPSEPIWIDATASIVEFSLAREFASVLKLEPLLRRLRILRGVSVHLERGEDLIEIEIDRASSGQLALISSLLFMITNAGERPIIIVDEPENSLHPNWQKEYLEKALAAMRYRGATFLIATHAPLIVTGALAENPGLVSVYEVREGEACPLQLDTAISSTGIEEILWRAFDVVTPANHFVSERVVAAISQFEKGQIEKLQVLDLIAHLDKESFDEKQKSFFNAVRKLVDEVEVARDLGVSGDDEDMGDGNA